MLAIAEQHAATFAAGLAIEGMNPFVAKYIQHFYKGLMI